MSTRGKNQPQSLCDSNILAAVKDIFKSNDFMQILSDTVKEVVSAKLEEIISKQEKLIKDLQDENHRLKLEQQLLSGRLDRTELYSRRNNLRLFGITENENEYCDDIAIKVFNDKMGLTLPLNSIERCHRVGLKKTNGRPRAILVKFCSYRDRRLVYDNKSKLKSKGVTIKEDLTSTRLKMLKLATEKINFRNVWSSDGTILIKYKNKIFKFDELSELEKFVSNIK